MTPISTPHISTLRLHQLRLGELSPELTGDLREHLALCGVCSHRLDAQVDARLVIARQPVPAVLLPARSWWERLRAPLAALAVLSTAVAMVSILPASPGSNPEQAPTERVKGFVPELEAWVESGTSARPLYTGERVGGGTRVQLRYNPGKHRFVTLAGRDAAGTVELYGTLPAAGPGLHSAPFSLTLDDSRGEQEFFAILTDIRPDPDVVLDVLKADPVRMDRGEIASVVLRKE